MYNEKAFGKPSTSARLLYSSPAAHQAPSLTEPPFLSIGIDFGTTAAWAKSTALDQVEVISHWSSHTIGSTDSEKVPSVISYDSCGEYVRWGSGVKSSDNPLQWTKLLLSPRSYTSNSLEGSIMESARRHMVLYNKSPVDVIADYLRLLWNHVLERLRIRLTTPVLEGMVFKLVLTVPAIWDQNAQTKMRLAAKRAGMLDARPSGETTLSLVAEPAAAALATYFDSGIRHNPILQVGDTFVVCDAGGGTVDLISYKIKSFEPLQLTECIGATGDLSGAVYIDHAFEELINTYRYKHMSSLNADARRRFMDREWEYNLKRNFDGNDGPWPVELPQIPHSRKSALRSIFKKEQSNILALNGNDLRRVFAAVLPKILNLLRDQVEGIKEMTGRRQKYAQIPLIILVGGFGSSPYLLRQIEQAFPGIIVQRPPRAWSAVCRGAVYRGAQVGHDIVVDAGTNHIKAMASSPKAETLSAPMSAVHAL
ncbi:hypothetical protein EG329_001754 [Mollisiaceae sp. DMI_Dod_QoI]|nr:hypothetical protein EG329_001754 [Helotiales sp. DMI_Dod_QoI]